MNKTFIHNRATTSNVPARSGWARHWQRWTPYAAVVWSLVYAVLGLYWAVSGRGFPYSPDLESIAAGPLLGRFGSGAAWVIVIMAGFPAAVMGTAMLREFHIRPLRTLFITAGVALAGSLLLFMTDLVLLTTLGYVPYAVVGLITGSKVGQIYLDMLAQNQWIITQQLICIIGGFLWLAATISYTRRSGDASAYIAAGETVQKDGRARTRQQAGVASLCMWRWWRPFSTPSLAIPGLWEFHGV